MGKMKRVLAFALVVVLALGLLASCNKDNGTSSPTASGSAPSGSAGSSCGAGGSSPAASGGNGGGDPAAPRDTTLIIGVTDAPTPVNPTMTAAGYMENMIFEALIGLDPRTGEYMPLLAESWEWLDNVTLKLNLRQDAYFTNGEHFVSSDALFSLQEKAKDLVARFSTYDWDNCSTPDDYTLILKFDPEYGPALAFLTQWKMMSQSWFESATADDFMYQPNGTGPYTITEHVSGSHCTFVRKDSGQYWGVLPEPTEVTYRYYAERSTMYIDFESGALDAAFNLTASDAARVLAGNAPAGTEYRLGSLQDVLKFILCENIPIWDDIRVREAFMISVDWDAVAQAVYGVLYIPGTSAFPSDVRFYTNVGKYEYNPERARELMRDAGLEGQRIQLRHICTPGNDVIAEAVQASVRELGFDMTIEMYDVPTAIPMLREGLSDFVTVQGAGASAVVDPDMFMNTLAPNSTLLPARFTSPEYVEWYTQSLRNDPNARASAYAEIQRFFMREFRIANVAERAALAVWNSNKIAEYPSHRADDATTLWVRFA